MVQGRGHVSHHTDDEFLEYFGKRCCSLMYKRSLMVSGVTRVVILAHDVSKDDQGVGRWRVGVLSLRNSQLRKDGVLAVSKSYK